MDDKIPDNVKVVEFASVRIKEVLTISSALENKHGPKRVYQSLPRNLRRRAMSYNVKRMPRCLREQHKEELLKQGRKPPTKRPSRKYRRRPTRLLEDYTRRKTEGKNTWLETHIWHAKRFKMSNLWGYKIATKCCCKIMRQTYRAVVKGATVEDISYFNCIELKGKQKEMIDGLSKLTSTECGETFKSENAITGEREGRTFIYHVNQYPYGAIGPVKFLWKPLTEEEITDMSERVIWIWVHPAIHDIIIKELVDVFELKLNRKRKIDDIERVEDENELKSSIENTESKPKSKKNSPLIPDTRISHLMKPINRRVVYRKSGIVLIDLKDNLVRFRMYGPQSTRILGNVLHPVNCSDNLSELKSKTWNEICNNGSLTELKPRCIFGLEVRDPRVLMPARKQMPKPNTTSGPTIVDFNNGLSQSLLWDKKIRDEATFGKISDVDINKTRSKCAVPGLELDLGDKESRIPVILIQNPGNRNPDLSPMNFGAGWDLILPSGWGMPFWISLVYNTALPVALDTNRTVNSAQCLPYFPYDFPDTSAGVEIMEYEKKELMDKDLKRPTAKRVNYKALSIASPYTFPWKELTKNYNQLNEDTEEEKDDFFVLRNHQELKKLNVLLQKKQNSLLTDFQLQRRCLVFVQLRPVAKGMADRLALICLPTEDDLKAYRMKSYSKIKETQISNVKKDESVKEKFAKCRKERKVIRRKLKSINVEEERKELEERISEIQPELQLPDYSQNTNISGSCSRQVIGFVTSCQYLLNIGEVVALGYCIDAGFRKIDKENNIVLLRKRTSLSYIFAKLNVVYNF